MDRQIVCFQIPAFEIALARLQNASLRNRPVAIARTHTSRACLHEVSREAQDDGLQPGMPVDLARRLCPSLRLVPPDPLRLGRAHDHVQAIVARYAPVWEPVRPGHVFLDLTGTTRLFGSAVDAAIRIERDMSRQQGFRGVMGIASNKLVSRVAAATLVQPPECRDVKPGSEQTFLAPLPVSILPGLSRTIARRTLTILNDLNLHALGQIAKIALPELESALGPPAIVLRRWAHGIDPSPVLPRVQRPCLEASVTLQPDDVDIRLCGILYTLLERLCRRLRRQQHLCRRLTLIIRHSDHVEVSRSHPFKPATQWEADMYLPLQELFVRCFQRRIRLRTMTISAEVTDGCGAPGEQLVLFDRKSSQDHPNHSGRSHPPTPSAPRRAPSRSHPLLHPPDPRRAETRLLPVAPSVPRRGLSPSPPRAHRLALALDHMRERFGEQIITYGRTSLAVGRQ